MTWIKICGLTRPEDARVAAAAGADAVGLVFYPPSPRAVTVAQAVAIAAAVPPDVAKVGVFVNESVARMADIRAAVGLDIIQLHGDETAATAAALGGRIIRAVRRAADAAALAAFPAEAMLVDGDKAGLWGGSGTPADDAAIAAVRGFPRWILSGGLAPDTVAVRVARWRPWGVDVSSGVESALGVKDPARIAAFVAAVRRNRSPHLI